MNLFNRTAVKALGGITALAVVCEAGNLAARAYGTAAGCGLVVVVFAACWIVHRFRSLMHPLSQRPREPQLPAQAGNAPAESRVPDMLPVL